MTLLPQGEEERRVVIYGLRVKSTGEIVYIGKSVNFKQRVASHKKAAKAGMVNLPIYRWMRVHDANLWQFVILAETTPTTWEDDERAWIAKYRELGQAKLNIDDGGAGRTPYVMGEETKKKLAETSRGNINSLGKPLSSEAKAKVTASLKSLWQDPEYRQKMSDAHKGKPSGRKGKSWTDKEKQLISERTKLGMQKAKETKSCH